MKTDLFKIATARNPYVVILVGNALAPRYTSGQHLIVTPSRTAKTGDVVLALCPSGKQVSLDLGEDKPDLTGEVMVPSFLMLNAHGELVAGGMNIPAGKCQIIGVVTGVQPPPLLRMLA